MYLFCGAVFGEMAGLSAVVTRDGFFNVVTV